MKDFLGNKRKDISLKIENIEKDENDKPVENQDINLKFIAKKKNSNDNKDTDNNTSEIINKIIKGDELVFTKRRQKAEELFKNL